MNDTTNNFYKTKCPTIFNRVQNQLVNKISYPSSLLSSLHGNFTKDGVEIDEKKKAPKLVDNSIFGIAEGSLAEIFINNVGSPWKESEISFTETKDIEREVIEIFMGYFGVGKDESRGYIASGGTEANQACLWWLKLWLKRKSEKLLNQLNDEAELIEIELKKNSDDKNLNNLTISHKRTLEYILTSIKKKISDIHTPVVFCTKDHTHHSIKKLCSIMSLELREVESVDSGAISLDGLRSALIEHKSSHPYRNIIMIGNIGTTVTGAIDDIPGIKKIFDKLTEYGTLVNYTIHLDAALYGLCLPITEPFGNIKNYFNELGVNTMIISGHKFLGSVVSGLALTLKSFLDNALSPNPIEYCGNIDDITVSGSRPGLNALLLYNCLISLEIDKGINLVKKITDHCLKNANFLYDSLIQIVGEKNILWNPQQFNIVIPKPSNSIVIKYRLMPTAKNKVVLCSLINVTKRLMEEFLNDYKYDMSSFKY